VPEISGDPGAFSSPDPAFTLPDVPGAPRRIFFSVNTIPFASYPVLKESGEKNWVMAAASARAIRDAALTLGITDRASLNAIHHRFHELVRQHHPDVSDREPEHAHEMFIRLKESYDLLVDYCMSRELSFRMEDLSRDTDRDAGEFWTSRFGDDPIWG
jgi:hypothetical protein